MKSSVLIAALAAASLLTAGVSAAQSQTAADAMFAATTLNLSAYGEARTAPDMATITFGVTTEAPTAQEAMRQNATRMTQVVAALRSQGVAERDIQTSGLTLNPQQVYAENQPPRITGYQASNRVTVTVDDIARLGASVDAVVGAGSNQIDGIAFGLKDPTTAENTARLAAVKALQAKADLYARATGLTIRRLVSLSESGGTTPMPPMPMARMAMMQEADAKTSVSPGELKVRVDIVGLYELQR